MIICEVSNFTPTPYNSTHINYLIKNKGRETHIFRFAPTALHHRKHYETTLSVFSHSNNRKVLYLIFTVTIKKYFQIFITFRYLLCILILCTITLYFTWCCDVIVSLHRKLYVKHYKIFYKLVLLIVSFNKESNFKLIFFSKFLCK